MISMLLPTIWKVAQSWRASSHIHVSRNSIICCWTCGASWGCGCDIQSTMPRIPVGTTPAGWKGYSPPTTICIPAFCVDGIPVEVIA